MSKQQTPTERFLELNAPRLKEIYGDHFAQDSALLAMCDEANGMRFDRLMQQIERAYDFRQQEAARQQARKSGQDELEQARRGW